MKKYILIIIVLLSFLSALGQAGVNTGLPQGTLHIDGATDNPSVGAPSATQQANDFIVTNTGQVGIGTTTPAATAILDATSTTKGFLLPRLTTAQMNTLTPTLTATESGLMIFNTDTNYIYFYDGSINKWRGNYTENSTSLNNANVNVSAASNTVSIIKSVTLLGRQNIFVNATVNAQSWTNGVNETIIGEYFLTIDGVDQPHRSYSNRNDGSNNLYKYPTTLTWSGSLDPGTHTITLTLVRTGGTIDTNAKNRFIDIRIF